MTVTRLSKTTTRQALVAAVALAALAATLPAPARADIYRWDNNQLIPGTQGLTPAPGINLSSLTLQYANLARASPIAPARSQWNFGKINEQLVRC